MVNSRPRAGSDKSILKEGPGGKQIDQDQNFFQICRTPT